MSDMGLEQDTSEVFRSATALNGRGDMGSPSLGGSKCVMRKFCNGVRVPVFLEDGDGPESRHLSAKRESHRSRMEKEVKPKLFPFGDNETDLSLMDLYTCPICMDPMIEVTAASCGHTFCRACLEEWSKIKPICPICSKEITHRIRLYNEDQFIEWLLRTNEDFPAELGRRLYEATKARMDKRAEGDRKSFLAKLRGKLDDLRLSCKSKGACGTVRSQFYNPAASATLRIRGGLRTLRSSVSSPSNYFPSWPSEGWTLLLWGIVIGIFAAVIISTVWNTNFFYYVYLSVKNYDGTIPPHLLDGHQPPLAIIGTTKTSASLQSPSPYYVVSSQPVTDITVPASESAIPLFERFYRFLRNIFDYFSFT